MRARSNTVYPRAPEHSDPLVARDALRGNTLPSEHASLVQTSARDQEQKRVCATPTSADIAPVRVAHDESNSRGSDPRSTSPTTAISSTSSHTPLTMTSPGSISGPFQSCLHRSEVDDAKQTGSIPGTGEPEREHARVIDEEVHRVIEGLVVQQAERERRILATQARLGSSRIGKKWLLVVTPSPVAVSSESFILEAPREAVLIPLRSTLPSQARLVADEFSLPTVTGVSLFLSLTQAQTPSQPLSPSPSNSHTSISGVSGVENPQSSRIRLTEESWRILWASHFEGSNDAQPVPGFNGLPIAGQIEFDVDHSLSRNRHRAERSDTRFTRPSDRAHVGSPKLYSRPPTPSWSNESSRADGQNTEDGHSYTPSEASSTPSVRPLSVRSHDPNHSRLSAITSSRSRSRLPTPISSGPSSPIRTTDRVPTSRSNFDSPGMTKEHNEVNSFAESTPIGPVRTRHFTLPSPNGGTSISQYPRRSGDNDREEEDEEDEEGDETIAGESSLDWTTELNRLKQIAETSLFGGPDVEEVSNETLTGTRRTEEPGGETRVTSEPCIATNSFVTNPLPLSPKAHLPLSTSSIETLHGYPFFRVYQPAYPHIELYPPMLATSSLSRPDSKQAKEDENNLDTVDGDVPEWKDDEHARSTPGSCSSQTDSPEQQESTVDSTTDVPVTDASVEWYHASTPLEASPVSSSYGEDDESEGASDSDGDAEGFFTVYDPTMLTTIQEESYTRGFTTQMEANDSRNGGGQVDVPSSDFGEEEDPAEEEDFAPIDSNSPDIPSIIRTRPSVSEPSGLDYALSPSRPAPLELRPLARSTSPLPSPTITPLNALAPLEADATSSEPEQPGCDFEYAAAADGTAEPGDEEELPYLSTPGLREALGFDDSPELHPLPYAPADESDFDSDDAREFPLDDAEGATLDPDDSCQTFDHLTPIA